MTPILRLFPLLSLALPLAAPAATTIFNFDDYDSTGAAGSGLASITVASTTDGAVSMTITASIPSGGAAELWADTTGLGVWHAGNGNASRSNSLDVIDGEVEKMTFTISNSSGTVRYVTDFTIRRDDRDGVPGATSNLSGGTITTGGSSFGVISDASGSTPTATNFATDDLSGDGSFPPIGWLAVPAGGSLTFDWVNETFHAPGSVPALDRQLAWRSITIIPEPSRAMLIMLAASAIGMRRQRR